MKKSLIIVSLVLAAFAAGVFAQATVALFPNTQVTEAQREKAVWAVCYLSGYGVVDGEEVPGAWDDDSAMWTQYRNELVKMLQRKYEVAKNREAMSELPPESSYTIGVE